MLVWVLSPPPLAKSFPGRYITAEVRNSFGSEGAGVQVRAIGSSILTTPGEAARTKTFPFGSP